MAFHDLLIENDAKIQVSKGQLLVSSADGEHMFPADDIDAVLLESRRTVASAAALSLLADNGAIVYICDERHMPSAVLLPYMAHSRQPFVTQLQVSASLPLRKRLWQSVVRAKIENQALCLEYNGECESADRLRAIGRTVRSGDTGNAEAVAAAAYFPRLFGAGFTRERECFINAALNYGYAIVRGAVARSVAVHGLLPLLGIHHDNDLNAFNLADDLMEPFRPMVDVLVSQFVEPPQELEPPYKRELFTVLNMEVMSDDRRFALRGGIENLVQSYIRSLQKREDALLLPKLLPPAQHRYE